MINTQRGMNRIIGNTLLHHKPIYKPLWACDSVQDQHIEVLWPISKCKGGTENIIFKKTLFYPYYPMPQCIVWELLDTPVSTDN